MEGLFANSAIISRPSIIMVGDIRKLRIFESMKNMKVDLEQVDLELVDGDAKAFLLQDLAINLNFS